MQLKRLANWREGQSVLAKLHVNHILLIRRAVCICSFEAVMSLYAVSFYNSPLVGNILIQYLQFVTSNLHSDLTQINNICISNVCIGKSICII